MSSTARSAMHAFGGPERDREADLKNLALKVGAAAVVAVQAIGDSKVIEVQRFDGERRRVTLADATASLTPRRVEEALYRDADIAVGLGSRAEWMRFAEIIAAHAERLEVPTDEDQTRSWVRRALNQSSWSDLLEPGNERSLAERYSSGEDRGSEDFGWNSAAWIEGAGPSATAVVSLERLSSFMTECLHLRGIGQKAIGQQLRAAGFTKERRAPRGMRPRKLWVIDAAKLREDEE